MFLDPSWWFSSSGTAQTPQGNDKNIFYLCDNFTANIGR